MDEPISNSDITIYDNGRVVAQSYTWSPRQSARLSESAKVIRNLKVGDCIKLTHGDVKCEQNGQQCSLKSEISRLREDEGWGIDYYHEFDHIMVIRRTK